VDEDDIRLPYFVRYQAVPYTRPRPFQLNVGPFEWNQVSFLGTTTHSIQVEQKKGTIGRPGYAVDGDAEDMLSHAEVTRWTVQDPRAPARAPARRGQLSTSSRSS